MVPAFAVAAIAPPLVVDSERFSLVSSALVVDPKPANRVCPPRVNDQRASSQVLFQAQPKTSGDQYLPADVGAYRKMVAVFEDRREEGEGSEEAGCSDQPIKLPGA